MRWQEKFYVSIFVIALILLFGIRYGCALENQLSARAGWHFFESGQTFAYADENDREVFDGIRVELEWALWLENWGFSISGGINNDIGSTLNYSPRWIQRNGDWRQTKARVIDYDAKLYTVELIPQYRFRLSRADIRAGFGLNYSYLDNEYSWTSDDTIDGFGWVGLLGMDYWFTDKKKWALSIDTKYVRNDLKSDKWSRTYYRVGGLVVTGGIKRSF